VLRGRKIKQRICNEEKQKKSVLKYQTHIYNKNGLHFL
jgi:hypothetical protein